MATTKVCTQCNEEKEIILMSKWTAICKSCKCINSKKYHEENTEKKKKYREENKEKIAQINKKYREENKEKINKRIVACQKKRLAEDPLYKLLHVLRSRIQKAIKSQATEKAAKSTELIGCSIEHFRAHIESQFTEGMTWENHGNWDKDIPRWHIDHILPCAKFNLEDPEEQKKCFNWTNMQPLWAKDNLAKGSK